MPMIYNLLFSLGLTSIISQFDNVNPYRWPGYFIASAGVVHAGVVLLIFRDVKPFPKLKHVKLNLNFNCLSSVKMMTQLTSKWKMEFIVS